MIITWFFLKLYCLFCKFYNKQYYRYEGVSKKAIFSPEFPGLIIIQSPKNLKIGDYTVINRGAHINAGESQVEIGCYCHIGKGLTIYAFRKCRFNTL